MREDFPVTNRIRVEEEEEKSWTDNEVKVAIKRNAREL